VVSLAVVAAALSAFSVWQATTFTEMAADAQNQERVAEGQLSEQLAQFNGGVDHDLRLLVRYCSALTQQQWALRDVFSDADDQVALGNLAGAAVRRDALSSLFQHVSPASCESSTADAPPYSVRNAYEWQAASDGGFGTADPDRLREASEAHGRAETALMQAGVAFTGALLVITLADSARRRRGQRTGSPAASVWRNWHVAWLAVAAALLVIGVGRLVWTVDLASEDLGWIAAVLVLGVVVSAPIALRAGSMVANRVKRMPGIRDVRWWRGRSIGWWGEIVGALTLVVFAATALGFSVASLRERDAGAAADRVASRAERVLELGEQSAVRDLAAVADLVELSVEAASNNQLALRPEEELGGDPAAAAVASEDLLFLIDHQVQEIEAAARRQQATFIQPKMIDPCGLPEETAPTISARELLLAAQDDASAFSDHVASGLEPGVACSTLAAVTRQSAAFWGDQSSLFTVALVVLGLAGFLLGSAGDPDRTRGPARWLLRVGIVGLVIGAAVSFMAASSLGSRSQAGLGGAGDEDARAFAMSLAAGRTAALVGECATAITHFDSAIDRLDSYPTAFVERAEAKACADKNEAVLTSSISPERLPGYIGDLESARQLGVTDSRVVAGLGWGYLLAGLNDGNSGELQHARRLAEDALAEFERSAAGSQAGIAPVVHVMRFNVAISHLAVDGDAVTHYGRALDCLVGEATCPGGHISDPQLQTVFKLSALADLELLDRPDSVLDPYRQLLIAGEMVEGGDGGPPLLDPELLVFPQEVQLTTTAAETTASDVVIVWYHRAAEDDPWAVLLTPSQATFSAGQHLGHPVNANLPLAAGEYRADVYAAGELLGRATGTAEKSPGGFRTAVRELGLAAVLPAGWERIQDRPDESYGVEAAFGPDGDRKLIVWREEATEAADVGELERRLDEWVQSWFDDPISTPEEPPDQPESQYFLALDPVLIRDYTALGWRAAAGFSSYASSSYCPGSLIMAMVPFEETAVMDSLVLSRELTTIPTLSRRYESPTRDFALTIPVGWDALEIPPGRSMAESQFVATDCETGTNLRIGSETHDGSLAEYVELNLRELKTFEDFELIERSPLTLPSGVPAEMLWYRWRSDSLVEQTQLYALSDATAYFATLTMAQDEIADYADERELLLETFNVTP
jgi:hypothetical protein